MYTPSQRVPSLLTFDSTRPDGVPRRLLDVSLLTSLGWRARVDLRVGIEQTYRWYLDQKACGSEGIRGGGTSARPASTGSQPGCTSSARLRK